MPEIDQHSTKINDRYVGCPFIRHIFFIRIMNIFDLLFEYSNNIRIFILLNKLPILAQISKKIQKSKNIWSKNIRIMNNFPKKIFE
jgi:hypothetical protein